VFIEHKSLYTRKEMADLDAPGDPWGRAVVRRAGADITIVTYSRMVHVALAAAATLAESGIEAEVIDLRTLNPLDMETVAASVERNGRAVVVSEGPLTAGVASELAARISEECFDFLEDPVIRLAAEDIPVPVSPTLESATIPTAGLIVSTVRRMLRR
jgi:pyruvate dehydrogenase E1 component beta subunit